MELKEVMNVMQVSGERIPSGYYKKPEVDAVIAEKDAEIAELQETNVIIANNAVRLNKDIAELKATERRLRRALYKACANWALAELGYEQLDSQMFAFGMTSYKEVAWESMASKCRAKEKEYK